MRLKVDKSGNYYEVLFEHDNIKVDHGGLLDENELLELQKDNISELLYYGKGDLFDFIVDEYYELIRDAIHKKEQK